MGNGGMWSMSGPMWMPDEPPTLARILGFHLQPVPILPALALAALIAYLAGVVSTRHAAGHTWPMRSTACWIAGVALVGFATSTGIEGYGMMIFSIHMAQHMLLALIVPILLSLGHPVRLARTALPVDSLVRRHLERVAACRAAVLLLSAPARWTLFLAALYGIYFTPLFGSLMHTVWGHNLMLMTFLVTGCLFFGPLITPRAGRRPAVAGRLAATFASAPLHAVFGLVILMAQHPVVHFFDHPAPAWHIDVVSDQSLAGAIAWATSEAATVLVMVVIAVHATARRRTTRARSSGRSARAQRPRDERSPTPRTPSRRLALSGCGLPDPDADQGLG